MATVRHSKKACAVNPLKMSQPIGGALAFMGLADTMPILHGSQGCTAFGMVLFVRHFKESIPLQTTAMSEVATVLGGFDNVEQAVMNIYSKSRPAIIGMCSTGLTEFARKSDEFARLTTKLIGLSIDSIHSHLAWRENLKSILDVEIPYPLIADLSMEVASKYGMLHPGASSTATVRAVFVIDAKRTIRALVYYPMNVGRNVDEVLRLVEALQTADAHACATPVNWRKGEKVIVPPPKTVNEVKERSTHKEYERYDFYLNKKSL